MPDTTRAAFPVPDPYGRPGMTYRQWLIGQALSNIDASNYYPKDAADLAIKVADAVIEKLMVED